MAIRKRHKVGVLVVAGLLLAGFALPEDLVIPVENATSKDWNHNTFWYEPWGASGVHKGIDIFASVGSPVISSIYGIVVFKGNVAKGGNVVAILGPKWHTHYYAHLRDSKVNLGAFVKTSEIIGSVGTSGNAKGKPPHLHYAILSLAPHFWRADASTQGWKKIFFLHPGEMLSGL